METLEEFIKKHTSSKEKASSFVEYLYSLMDKYGFENTSDLYNKANISRQLWSSIISEKSNPSLNVCLKLAFAMHVTNHECKYLLKKAGYTLASSNKYSLIIRYAIENEIYDIYKVNELLEQNGYADSLII
jgi:DNA-binding XRE family transcriptional regulator